METLVRFVLFALLALAVLLIGLLLVTRAIRRRVLAPAPNHAEDPA